MVSIEWVGEDPRFRSGTEVLLWRTRLGGGGPTFSYGRGGGSADPDPDPPLSKIRKKDKINDIKS